MNYETRLEAIVADAEEQVRAATARMTDAIEAITQGIERRGVVAVEQTTAAIMEHVGTLEARANGVVADLAERAKADRAVMLDAYNKAIPTAVEKVQQAADAKLAELAALSEKVQGQLDRLGSVTAEAQAAAAELATAKAAHDATLEKATAEAEKAEKAMAALALVSDVEVKRAVAEIELNREEKRMIAEIRDRKADLANRADVEWQAAQRAVQTFYPELQARLDEIASQAEEADGAAAD